MEAIWFWLLAFLIAGYVLLDGYDLGAGVMHLTAARTEGEKKQVLASIAPFWDANEVWLITAGGTLYLAFPAAYASSFSGFYLPLMIVLWLLILRGIAIELRNHIASPVWTPFWDAVFGSASAALAFVFGVAIGNLVRGVPVDASGDFFLPLWTNLLLSGPPAVFDVYTLLVGLLSLCALTVHGAAWVSFRVVGPLGDRVRRQAIIAAGGTLLVLTAITAWTLEIQPRAMANLREQPWGGVFPFIAFSGLSSAIWFIRRDERAWALMASAASLIGLLGSAAFTLFPFLLASSLQHGAGLTVHNSNAGNYGMQVALWWWIPGMVLATGYAIFTHRHFSEKISE